MLGWRHEPECRGGARRLEGCQPRILEAHELDEEVCGRRTVGRSGKQALGRCDIAGARQTHSTRRATAALSSSARMT